MKVKWLASGGRLNCFILNPPAINPLVVFALRNPYQDIFLRNSKHAVKYINELFKAVS